MSDRIDIRHGVRREDREVLEAMVRATGFFDEHEVGIALEVFDDAMKGPEAGYEFLFAERDGAQVGYAAWGRDEQTVDSWELYWIVVDPRLQSTGVGGEIMRAVEACIRRDGGGQLFVETAGRDQYLPTRRFYERQGYRQAAWLDDYFAPGDARVIFVKRL